MFFFILQGFSIISKGFNLIEFLISKETFTYVF